MTIQSIFKQESTVNNTSGGFSILKRKVCQSYVKTRKTGDINPYNFSKIRDCLKIYTISLEYLTEEKFYPLGTTDKYFEAPYEEYPITICGQTIILTNGELAAALLSLPERNREIIFLYFFGDYTQQEIGEMYGRCRSTTGYQIRRTLKLLQRKMEVLSHGEYESFVL